MSVLAQVSQAVDAYARFVEQQVARARSEAEFREQLLQRWQEVRARVDRVATPSGLELPRLALPPTDEPGEIARYLYGEGLPGEFPFMNAAYAKMYAGSAGTSERRNVEAAAAPPDTPPVELAGTES